MFIVKKKELNLTIEQQQITNDVAATYDLLPFIAARICKACNFDETTIENYIQHRAPLRSYTGLRDAEEAAKVIKEHIDSDSKIRIIGDYDVDGVTSTYLMLLGLNYLLADVDYYLPDRHKDGYGMKPYMVEKAAEDGVKLIITVDNGIVAFDSVERAKELGIDLIITDHHDLKDNIVPDAKAVVDPKRFDCSYPFKQLAGVGVAYKVLQATFSTMGATKIPSYLKLKMYALVALGTVCDGMDLVEENRYLLLRGLDALNKRAFPQFEEFCKSYSVGTIGFQIGPRLNACGRIHKADDALEFLDIDICDAKFQDKVDYLNRLNSERQDMQAKGIEEAKSHLESLQDLPKVIVITLEECDEGVIGLIASDIVKIYKRPAIVFTKTGKDAYKGSGRSPEEFNFYEQLKPYIDLTDGGGGHDSVCGLNASSLEQIKAFDCAIQDIDFTPPTEITSEEHLTYWDVDFIDGAHATDLDALEQQIAIMQPCGNGNVTPKIYLSNVPINIVTRHPKGYTVSDIELSCGDRKHKYTLWGRDDMPASYGGLANVVIGGSAKGLEVKDIEIPDVRGFEL